MQNGIITIRPQLDPQSEARIPKAKRGSPTGFSLVELMVSVAISAILMVGISIFFSSTFRNMFDAQNQAQNTEKQFVVNEIIRNKFATLKDVITTISKGSTATNIITYNKNTNGQLPFTYIGKNTSDNLVFKDFMFFNKMWSADGTEHLFANSGSGNIGKMSSGSGGGAKKNFSGFIYIKEDETNYYYITIPTQNKIMKCDNSSCSDFELTGFKLKSPTDIATNGTNILYISDSENGRIIEYDILKKSGTEIVTKHKYPTGLAYYKSGTYERLFFSETLGNKVKSYNISEPNKFAVETIVGDGDDEDCGSSLATYKHTAKFCKLNMPTGLFVFDSPTVHELYIADSGNNRILRVSDPPVPTELNFKIDAKKSYALDRITFENDNWTNADSKNVYDKNNSNLIGDETNFKYSNGAFTFSNSGRMTTYTGTTACKANTNYIYVNEDMDPLNIKADHSLIVYDAVGKKTYTFTVQSPGFETNPCKETGSTSSLTKGKINVKEDASSISGGLTVYPATPKKIQVKIKDPKIEIASGKSGFQKFTVKIYDIFEGLAHTSYVTQRIGNGVIGTDEDVVTVVAANQQNQDPVIKFPTGVTNLYFANSGKDQICSIANPPTNCTKTLDAIDTNFTKFDYTSDFALNGALEFKKYNKMLELKLKAKISEDKEQIYILNASLP